MKYIVKAYDSLVGRDVFFKFEFPMMAFDMAKRLFEMDRFTVVRLIKERKKDEKEK